MNLIESALLFFSILIVAGSSFFLLGSFVKLSVAVHRRAREIIYMQDNGLEIDAKTGFFEVVAQWQANKDRRERERSLPSAGDFITLKPMYAHMLRLDSVSYLVLGLSSAGGSEYNSHIELQRSDGTFEKMKISEWDDQRFEITKASQAQA